MIYFIYNKYKNLVFYIYDFEQFEKIIGNVERIKSAPSGFLKIDDFGFDGDAQVNTTFESTSGGNGGFATNFSEENKKYTFNFWPENNGVNYRLATRTLRLYPNQTLILGAIDPDTNKGFITQVVKADDSSLEDGILSFISQSNNMLFDVEFGSSVKEITFIKQVYTKTPTSDSDYLTIESEDFIPIIVKYPNANKQQFTIENITNDNLFVIAGTETNIEVDAYDRTAESDNGDLFSITDAFAGGFIFLDQGTNQIMLEVETYGETFTIEIISQSEIRKDSYV